MDVNFSCCANKWVFAFLVTQLEKQISVIESEMEIVEFLPIGDSFNHEVLLRYEVEIRLKLISDAGNSASATSWGK